jgi:hypothetical protein
MTKARAEQMLRTAERKVRDAEQRVERWQTRHWDLAMGPSPDHSKIQSNMRRLEAAREALHTAQGMREEARFALAFEVGR